jgi:hypothetical protein
VPGPGATGTVISPTTHGKIIVGIELLSSPGMLASAGRAELRSANAEQPLLGYIYVAAR